MAPVLTQSERVALSIREMILRGELDAGARLGEAELAAALGVSRTPVREALGRLGAEGLVQLIPNRGARVATWTLAELESVFELRATLEPRLAALAVPAATEDDIAELDRLAHAMLEVGLPGIGQDLDALVPLNREFHDRLVALADEPAMANALAGAVKTPIQVRNFHAYDEASLRRSLSHHLEIVDALRARVPAWAQAVMTAHIHNARAVLMRSTAVQPTDTSTAPPEETP